MARTPLTAAPLVSATTALALVLLPRSAVAAESLGSDGSKSVDTDGSGSNVSTIAPRKASNSDASDTGTHMINDGSNAGGSGQRYDLVAAVSAVAVVVIAALLFIMRRNNKRTRMHRDVYKSSSDDEPLAPQQQHQQQQRESVSSMSSTWKVGSTNTQTLLRVSSPTLTQSTGGDSYSTSSGADPFSTEPMNGIWRDPVIAAARIPFEQIKMRSLLCRGAFGEVFDGTCRGERVAIKRLLPETRQHVEHLEYFMLEVRMMASLRHARIVTFVGVAWDAMQDLCIVSELMAHGDLRKVLQRWKQHGDVPTGWNATKLRIALHVAQALTYLHSLSPKLIIHRDLKSRNVLIDASYNAKLSDFGVSREHSAQLTRTLTANIGSSLWMAPEIMLGENYDETADIFSFGIVLTELDTHALPYHDVSTPDGRRLPEPAVLHMVTIGSVQAQFSPASRADIVALGRECLSLDRSVRPRASELVQRFSAMLAALEAPIDA